MILYDFTDPEDYDYNEEKDALEASKSFGKSGGDGGDGGSSGSGSPSKPSRKQLQAWKRTKRGKDEKLPCVRLLSTVHKEDGSTKVMSGDDESGSGSGGNGGDAAAGEDWVDFPTVPVLLESIGKVKTETVFSWGGGRGRLI